MDEHTHDDFILSIRDISKDVTGVIATEKCLIRKTGMKYHVDLHIIVNGEISVREGHIISHKLKSLLQNKLPEISNILIHVEPKE